MLTGFAADLGRYREIGRHAQLLTAVLQLFDAARPRFGQTLLDGKRIQ